MPRITMGTRSTWKVLNLKIKVFFDKCPNTFVCSTTSLRQANKSITSRIDEQRSGNIRWKYTLYQCLPYGKLMDLFIAVIAIASFEITGRNVRIITWKTTRIWNRLFLVSQCFLALTLQLIILKTILQFFNNFFFFFSLAQWNASHQKIDATTMSSKY